MPKLDVDRLKDFANDDDGGGGSKPLPEFVPFPVKPSTAVDIGSPIPLDLMYQPGPDRLDYDALRSTLEQGEVLKNDQIDRLLGFDVKYMELSEPAGAFSCGQCLFAAENSFCNNTAVLAPVSAMRGCCSKFWPKLEAPRFPPGKPC